MDALDKLRMMTAATAQPTITEPELEAILASHVVADADGVLPTEDDWVPTYSMRSAIREGWLLKLGRAAELQSTDLDGDRMSANQIFEHCERMVRRYSGTASPTTV